jgi:nucleoside-diphosphate-sugar epimerase
VEPALVTGGTGFVGANLTRRLLDDGVPVHLLVRPGHQTWRLAAIRDDVTLHEVSIEDRSGVDAALQRVKPRWVFHLAAYGAYHWQSERSRMMRANFEGTANVVDAGIRHGCDVIVNAGSSSEYGAKDHAPLETERPDPNSEYAITKLAATNYCSLAADRAEARICTLRLYSAYGPWEEPRRLVPTLLTHVMRGTWPPLADPSTARDYVYVEDVVDAFIAVARAQRAADHSVYNVAAGTQVTLADIASTVASLVPIESEPTFGAYGPHRWDTTTWVGDSSLLKEEFDWSPRTSLREGLATFLEWLEDEEHAGHYREKAGK